MRYFAKPDTWFDAGTEVFLVADCDQGGWLMSGMHEGKEDEELCDPDEFEVVKEPFDVQTD